MFNFFKKEEFKIVAPVNGKLIPLSEAPDDVFSQKLMGDGFAIHPTGNVVVAPISGVAVAVFPTGHAVGIKTNDGIECIVHIGIDTVELNGEGFKALITQGEKIKAGQPVVEFDKEVIKGKGFNLVTMTVFPAGYSEEFNLGTKDVESGEQLI